MPSKLIFVLRPYDYFSYLVGSIARIQTLIIAYILFNVETENVCIVTQGAKEPIP